ncbi:MAG: DUF262 domain-containing protein [Muribaculaceae bacterium]|nr:DUF262 domain-containing protein [Muribaculaceae bacterium]
MKKSEFKTGNKYKISQFFSGENDKINIPDLQRDYCWGENENLIRDFLDNIILLYGPDNTKYSSHKPAMGLIYGYFQENFDSFLQLCDGQQRLTTIFLILGMLQRMSGRNIEGNNLMSEFEYKDDDHEPYLRYGIRESSLYFLSDLTYYYFLSDTGEGYDIQIPSLFIKNQPWYLHEYSSDPTISNILRTIDIITDVLKEKNFTSEELIKFSEEIGNIEFLYYDMESRVNGEKTFVIINTTGEPLSPTQNLKPLIMNEGTDLFSESESDVERRKEISLRWEQMETWFWRNRNENEETADPGFNAFLNAVAILFSADEKDAFSLINNLEYKFPYKQIKFEDIFSTFKNFIKIIPKFNNIKELRREGAVHSARQLYILLPLLKYLHRFPKAPDEELEREFQLFLNMSRYRTIDRDARTGYVPAYRMLNIVDKESQPAMDVFSLIQNGFREDLEYSIEERTKLIFVQNLVEKEEDISHNKENERSRENIEQLIWHTQALPLFNGKIEKLVNWSNNNFNKFKITSKKIEDLIVIPVNQEYKRDLLRRFLLINQLPERNTIWYSWSELRELTENSEFLNFIESIDVDTWLENIKEELQNFSDITNPFYLIIKDDNLISKIYNRQFILFASSLLGIRMGRNNDRWMWIYKNESLLKNNNYKNISYINATSDGNFLFADLKDWNLRLKLNIIDRKIEITPIDANLQLNLSELLIEKINNANQQIQEHETTEGFLSNYKNLLDELDNLYTIPENTKS